MAEEGFKRKLTAILSADVEGYSRLMAEDEAAYDIKSFHQYGFCKYSQSEIS